MVIHIGILLRELHPKYKRRSFTKLLVGLHDCSRMPAVPRKYHPPVLRHHRLATALAALQVLLGIAVTSLAVWLLVWAPNLRVRDIPYWSGLPVSSTVLNISFNGK